MGPPARDDNRGRSGSQAAHGGHQDEDAFPSHPIGQRCRQRCKDCRGHHAQQPHQPDCRRAAIPVGHDSQCHGEGPLSGPGSQKAELRAAQIPFTALPASAATADRNLPHGCSRLVTVNFVSESRAA